MKNLAPKLQFLMVAAIMIFTILIFLNLEETEIPKQQIASANNWSHVQKLEQQEMLNRAQYLLNLYFEADVIIINSEAGPSSSLIVNAKINGENRQFILLGDKDHLIEGTIYSPYITPNLLTNSHSKKAVEIATENGELINRIQDSKQQFLASSKSSLTPPAPVKKPIASVVPRPQPAFRLPENNSVFGQDKKQALFQKVKELEYIEFGKSDAPLVYVFFDFECPACKVTEKMLLKATKNGELRVRFIPVGVISEESPAKAAYSLIPDLNADRQMVFEHFRPNKSLDELLNKKATEREFKNALRNVLKTNTVFFELPKALTPTFVYEHNQSVTIASFTSSNGLTRLISQLNNK